jgi:hypothetical protein
MEITYYLAVFNNNQNNPFVFFLNKMQRDVFIEENADICETPYTDEDDMSITTTKFNIIDLAIIYGEDGFYGVEETIDDDDDNTVKFDDDGNTVKIYKKVNIVFK